MRQVDVIRKQLLDGNTLTQRSALLDFGIMALPRRVADLRESGFPVKVEMKANPNTGQRYASYSMENMVTKGTDLVPGNVYKMVDIKWHPFCDDLVENSQGYLRVDNVCERGTFTCRIAGKPQIHFCGALEDGDFKLKYIGGMA